MSDVYAKMPDGAFLKFPKDTPQEIIDRAAQDYLAERGLLETSPSEPVAIPDPVRLKDAGLFKEIQDPTAAQRIARPVARGISSVIGLLGDVPALAGQSLEIDPPEEKNIADRVFGLPSEVISRVFAALEPATSGVTSEAFEERFRQAAVIPEDPEFEEPTLPGRLASTATEFMTAGALPAGVLARFGRPGLAAGELVAAGGAGLGAQTARELAPDSQIAELVGALVGGATSPAAVSRVKGVADNVADRAKGAPASPKPSVRRDVGRELSEASANPEALAGDVTGTVAEIEEVVPSFQPTTGQVTQDPGLQALEQNRPSRELAQRHSGQNQAATSALGGEAPEAKDDAATRAALERRRARALERQRQRAEAREQARDAQRQALEPSQSRQETGETIRAEISDELKDARMEERRLWEAIDPESSVTVQTSEIKARTRDILDDTPSTEAPEDTPALLREIAGEATEQVVDTGLVDESGASITRTEVDEGAGLLKDQAELDEILALRSRVQDEIRAEKAAVAPSRNKIRKLTEVSEAINDSLAEVGTAISDPDAAARFQEATAFSRELNDRFTRGTTGRVLAKDKPGAERVPDSGVAAKFFRSGDGSPEAIEDFTRAVGNRPNAVKALREFALSEAMEALGDGNAQALGRWRKKHAEALEAFPDLDRDFGSLEAAEQAVRREQRRLALLEKATSDPRSSVIAKYLSPEDARDSIKGILEGKRPVQQTRKLLASLKGDKDAIEGARRAAWDLMTEGAPRRPGSGVKTSQTDLAGGAMLDGDRFKNFLESNKGALEVLYRDQPSQLDRIRRLANVVRLGQKSGARTTGRAGDGGVGFANIPGLTFAGFLSRSYSVKRGVVSPTFVVLETLGRIARGRFARVSSEQFETLLDRALLDPELAKTLVMEYNAGNAKVIKRRLIQSGVLDFLAREDKALGSEEGEDEGGGAE